MILWLASGVSNEGGSSPLLVLLPAVSWPWVPAWGSLEPPRRDGENAQKTGKNGGKMGEIRPKTCEGVGITWSLRVQALGRSVHAVGDPDTGRAVPRLLVRHGVVQHAWVVPQLLDDRAPLFHRVRPARLCRPAEPKRELRRDEEAEFARRLEVLGGEDVRVRANLPARSFLWNLWKALPDSQQWSCGSRT